MISLLRQLFVDPPLARIRIRCAIVLYAAILVFGSIPGARADIGQVASGVVLHSLAYAGLTLLIFGGVRAHVGRFARALTAFCAIAAMGALDETVQSFFPYRGASVGDWLVDCSAAFVTASLLYLLWPHLLRPALARP
jgi:VanZ family protein